MITYIIVSSSMKGISHDEHPISNLAVKMDFIYSFLNALNNLSSFSQHHNHKLWTLIASHSSESNSVHGGDQQMRNKVHLHIWVVNICPDNFFNFPSGVEHGFEKEKLGVI